MPKKILYIKAQGLGDMIGGIPFLLDQKRLGNEVCQTFYDMKHFDYALSLHPQKIQEQYKKTPMYEGWLKILQIFKTAGLLKDYLIIPFGLFHQIRFVFRNFRIYDEAVIPIKTNMGLLLGYLLSKKVKIIAFHNNDIKSYVKNTPNELKYIHLNIYNELNIFPAEYIAIPKKYITIYPSTYDRSLELGEWVKLFSYFESNGFSILLIGGDREKWFSEALDLQYKNSVLDYISKTSLSETVYILKNAELSISCNGGIMRLSNLVQKKNINIHTVSAYLMEPPVNNKDAFNIRTYSYSRCMPCESGCYPHQPRVTGCKFFNSNEEGACRKNFLLPILHCAKRLLKKN